MATLSSIQGDIQLTLRLLGKSYDPFQVDLEWFEYELRVEGRRQPTDAPAIEPPSVAAATPAQTAGRPGGAEEEHRTARGKMNRKDFNELLRGLDELLEHSRPMRFEPDDLSFYFEWSRETALVYLIVTWFDLALSARRFDQRFPSAHAGFRFLTDRHSLAEFRRAVEEEFAPPPVARARKASSLIN